MIAIIGAMDEEIKILEDSMDNRRRETRGGYNFFLGTLASKDVVVMKSGIGKVNAALSAQKLMGEYAPSIILNCGSAGGLDRGQSIGDVVIATELRYHDADARGFGYELGQIPGMPEKYVASPDLLDKARSLPADGRRILHFGPIVSGDSFLSDSEDIARLLGNFPGSIAVEMESTAIAQACYLMGLPFLVIRAISDRADGNSPEDFSANLHRATVNSARTIIELVEIL